MDLATAEENVKSIISQEISKENFLYQLLAAYGQPQSSITRLRNGGWNSSKKPGEVFWKKHLLFVSSENVDFSSIDVLSKSEEAEKHKIRFVMVTNFERFLAIDRKTLETLDISLSDLGKHAEFFFHGQEGKSTAISWKVTQTAERPSEWASFIAKFRKTTQD